MARGKKKVAQNKAVRIRDVKMLDAAKAALQSRYKNDGPMSDAEVVHVSLVQTAFLNSNPNVAAHDATQLLDMLKKKTVSATIANTLGALEAAGVEAEVKFSPDGSRWFLEFTRADGRTVQHLIATATEFEDVAGEVDRMGKTLEVDPHDAH